MKNVIATVCYFHLLILLVSLTGCCSVLNGPRQDVRLYSTPENAEVKIYNRENGRCVEAVTPSVVSLTRRNSYDVQFSKAGFVTTRRSIDRQVASMAWVGCLCYGIPLLVDYATGSMWELNPGSIDVALVKQESNEASKIQDSVIEASREKKEKPIDLAVFASHPQRGCTLGVLDFTARSGMPQAEVAMLTERFVVEIDGFSVYKLISIAKRDEILKEQKFSQACDSQSCAIELGKTLASQYLVYGSVGKFGSLYSVTLYLVDVENNVIVASASVDVNGGIETLLTESMRSIAKTLVDGGMKIKQ